MARTASPTDLKASEKNTAMLSRSHTFHYIDELECPRKCRSLNVGSQSVANVQLSRLSNIAHQLIQVPAHNHPFHEHAGLPLEMPTSQTLVVESVPVSSCASNGDFCDIVPASLYDDGCSFAF